MSRPPADESGHNVFHALAALGQVKQASKTISTTQRKITVGGLSAKDKDGRTPLHLAAYHGNIRVLKAFMDAAPEAAEIRDASGNNALDALMRPLATPIGRPENNKYFQRLMIIDKLGPHYPEFDVGPADVWDLATSGNSILAIVQPTWEAAQDNQSLYASMKNRFHRFDLGPQVTPRYVATSNIHSLAVTADRCYAWGKNTNGVLGLDTEEKLITEPRRLDETFAEYSSSTHVNTFSALGGLSSGEIKNPLIGVACSDFNSMCYTTTKLWAWGANRGQMLNKAPKNAVVDAPILIYQSQARIRSATCTDHAIVILLTNGQIVLLHNDRSTTLSLGKGQVEAEAIASRGDFIVVQTTQGKILRYTVKSINLGKEDAQTIWVPRRPKDSVLSFDVADNGGVVVATKSGVFRLEDAASIHELRNLRGVHFSTINSDPHFRNFVGVQQIIAGLGSENLDGRMKLLCSKPGLVWDAAAADGDIILRVCDEEIKAHSAVIYARCSSLRSLIAGDSDAVGVPGGSTVFRRDGTDFIVEHASSGTIHAFLKELYITGEPFPDNSVDIMEGVLRHELRALQRIVTTEMGLGLWAAKNAGIGCDVKLDNGSRVHSAVLRARSPVLAAQLARWFTPSQDLEIPSIYHDMLDEVIHYMYTKSLPIMAAEATHSGAASRQLSAQQLFDMWQSADELLMPCLSDECEKRLFEMLDSELSVPFIEATSRPQGTPSSRLFHSLLDIMARNMSYFVGHIGELDGDVVDALERTFKLLEGTWERDPTLAESYEYLRTLVQDQPQAAYSQPTKLKKLGNRIASGGCSSASTGQVGTPLEASTVASLKASSPLQHSASPADPQQQRQSKPTSHVANNDTDSSGRSGGWIQAGKKGRSSSHVSQAKSGALRGALGASPGQSKQPLQQPLGPTKTIPPSGSPVASTSPASSVSTRKEPPSILSELPSLGSGLPSLGQKQRSQSSSKSSRQRFSQKDRKNMQQFDSPFDLAQEMGRSQESPATPWKQVSTRVSTSPSVLEQIQRAQQVNNRRISGKVWGSLP